MEIERLITELATTNGILFVIGSEIAVSEMDASPDKPPTFHEGWAEVRGEGWHMHINLGLVTGIQFVEQSDHGTIPTLYYVRFSEDKGETIFRTYFPNPYLDEHDKLTDFQPEKLKLFEEFRDRFVDKEGITFVVRSRVSGC